MTQSFDKFTLCYFAFISFHHAICHAKSLRADSAHDSTPTSPPTIMSSLTSSRVVTTQYGKVRGLLLKAPQPGRITKLSLYPGVPPTTVEVFYGLQYATVFGGNLRFMPPTSSIEKWEGVKLAGNFQPVCPQKIPDLAELSRSGPLKKVERVERMIPFLRQQDEECLFLNIYVPYNDKPHATNSSLLPVLMFIHGESYDYGSGNSFDGRVLAAFGLMVVVTINYRLGVLGFLSTTDSDATGNYALLDQVAALHWIRANIQGFGGNPDNVAIMGQGHGATMASILMMSPVTKGSNLFQKIILQSGSVLGPSSIDRTPLAWTWHVSEAVNCSQFWSNSRFLVDCLKKLPWQLLVDVRVPNFRYRSSFGPTIDGRSVLPQEPEALLKEQCCDSSLVFPDMMIGVAKDEGLQYLNETQIENGVERDQLQLHLRTFVQNVFTFNRQYIYEVVYHQYQDWQTERDTRSVRDFVADFLGDALHVSPTINLIRRRVNNIQQHAHFLQSINTSIDQSPLKTRTYMYCFNFQTTHKSPTASKSYTKKPNNPTAMSGDELVYIFGDPLIEQMENVNSRTAVYTERDREFSEMAMIHWKNFVHNGNPNPKVNGQPMMSRDWSTSWIEYDAWSQSYLEIDEKPTLRHFYKVDKIALWLDLIPKLHRSDASKDPRHHQLDDHLNRSTFLPSGTKFDAIQLNSSLQSSSTDQPTLSKFNTNQKHLEEEMSTMKYLMSDKSYIQAYGHKTSENQQQRLSNVKKYSKRISTSNPSHFQDFNSNSLKNKTADRNLHDLQFVRDGVSFQETEAVENMQRTGTENLPLTITLAVGCGLLFVNLLIFGLVCFRKVFVLRKRTLNSRKMRQYKLDEATGSSNCTYPRNCGVAVESCLDQSPAMSDISTLNDQFPNHHHLHHHHLHRLNHLANQSTLNTTLSSHLSKQEKFKNSPGHRQGSPAYRKLESAFQLCLKQTSREDSYMTSFSSNQNDSSDLVQLTNTNAILFDDDRSIRTSDDEMKSKSTRKQRYQQHQKQQYQQQEPQQQQQIPRQQQPQQDHHHHHHHLQQNSTNSNYSQLLRTSKETDVT